MKKLSLICCLMISTLWLHAQSDSAFSLLRTMRGDIVAFSVDNLDNIYVLNSRNQVKKYNAAGDSMGVFNDVKKFGNASLIDVSNPLRLLLYYKDYTTVVMLDRFLNQVNTIDLRRQNIFQARAIAQSYDNKIWVYDEAENKLKKVDENGKLLLETPDFRLLMGQAPQPQKIFDQDKLVYLYDPALGVFVFDYFGAQRNNILIRGWDNFKVAGQYIFGSRADTLYRYEIKSFMYDEWKMPAAISQSRSFTFSASRLYALKNDGIDIYTIR